MMVMMIIVIFVVSHVRGRNVVTAMCKHMNHVMMGIFILEMDARLFVKLLKDMYVYDHQVYVHSKILSQR